jgi:hypothetical protein
VDSQKQTKVQWHFMEGHGHVRRAFGRQVVMFGLIIALVMAAVPLGASASHSWGNYH